ncbi:hypothetical protein BDN70DRAFT_989330 [Pholiota conissans]|uniref:Uncharacterized protein n=1 Tax=Pholiota conissans TaxID=109636 RepID=A0A9P6D5S7_9AGAR|nr:hypothetical protein BDN70DRAFT_989330 [Pholiota conissans]
MAARASNSQHAYQSILPSSHSLHHSYRESLHTPEYPLLLTLPNNFAINSMLQQKRTYATIDYFAQLQERYDDAEYVSFVNGLRTPPIADTTRTVHEWEEFGTCTFKPALTSLQWNLEEVKVGENGNSHSRKKRKSEAKESPNAPSSSRHNRQLSPIPTSFCRPTTLNTAPTMDTDVMTSRPPYNQLVVQPSASPSTPHYPQTEFQSWKASLPPSTSSVYQRLQDVLNSQVLRPHTPHFPVEQATNRNTWTATPKSA